MYDWRVNLGIFFKAFSRDSSGKNEQARTPFNPQNRETQFNECSMCLQERVVAMAATTGRFGPPLIKALCNSFTADGPQTDSQLERHNIMANGTSISFHYFVHLPY
jgi:hypothetical protein